MGIINWTVLSVGSLFLLCAFNIRAIEQHEKDGLKERKTFSFKVKRIAEVADCLSKIYQLPVCVEEARWFFREEDPVELKEILEKRRKKGFMIKSQNKSLQEVLEGFVKRHPEYQWEFDKNNIVFNLSPQKNAITNHVLSVESSDINLKEIIKNDSLDLKKFCISFVYGSKTIPWNYKISVMAHSKSLRNILNALCHKFPQPYYWTINELQKKDCWNTFWDGTTRKVKYCLQFNLFSPYDPDANSPNSGKLVATPEHRQYMEIEWEKWKKELKDRVNLEEVQDQASH